MTGDKKTDRRKVIKAVGSVAGTTAFAGIAAGDEEDHSGHGQNKHTEHPGKGRGHMGGHPGRGHEFDELNEEYEYDVEITSRNEYDDIVEVNIEVEKTHIDDPADTEVREFAYEVSKSGGAVKGGEIHTGDEDGMNIQRSHHPIPPDADDIIERWGYWVEDDGSCDDYSGYSHLYFGLTFELTEGADAITTAAMYSAFGALLGSIVPGGGTLSGAIVGAIVAGVQFLTTSTEYTIACNEWDQSLYFTDQAMHTWAASNSYNQTDKSRQTRFSGGPGHPIRDYNIYPYYHPDA